jgi:acetyl-CoA C-acetyltransferase
MPNSIVILGARRTPIGALQGALASQSASDLGAAAIAATVGQAGCDPSQIDKMVMGCVLMAGQGQAPARQAALKAGLAQSAVCVTVNKMCGSGMQAVMDAHDALVAGSADLVVAGGMESMTRAPYLLPKHRSGVRMGHDIVQDSMFLDGLEDAYEPGKLMGAFADDAAREYQLTRRDQDAYALESLSRAKAAQRQGHFDAEIVAIETGAGVWVSQDEQPGKGRPDRIPTLKPAFQPNGTVTAANAASISDGAAALLLAREDRIPQGATPVARIVAHSAAALAPGRFAMAPVPALQAVLAKAGWLVDDVDLFEINEAFAAVAMIAMQDLGISHDRLNVNGGACALGHPIGASGARILTTLIHSLKARGLTRGVASLCIGGGEATAMAIEVF